MALYPCRECGEEVSLDAKSCPKCGAKHPAMDAKKTAIGCGVIIAMGMLWGLFDLWSSAWNGLSDSPIPDRFSHAAPEQIPLKLRIAKATIKDDQLLARFVIHNASTEPVAGQLRVEFEVEMNTDAAAIAYQEKVQEMYVVQKGRCLRRVEWVVVVQDHFGQHSRVTT